MMKLRQSHRAFTIIESLVMLVVLALLFWVVFSLWRSNKLPSMQEASPTPSSSALLNAEAFPKA